MSITNTFENLVLTWLLTANAATRPAAWFLGLSSANPDETGSGNVPPTDPAYARKPVTFVVTGNVAANTGVIEFNEATVNQGVLTHATVWDAVAGGNLISYGLLRDNLGNAAPVTVNIGQILRVPIGAFTISAD